LGLGPFTLCSLFTQNHKKLKTFASMRITIDYLLYSLRVWRYTASTALPSSFHILFQPCFECWMKFQIKRINTAVLANGPTPYTHDMRYATRCLLRP
jgi:hypothetical protein